MYEDRLRAANTELQYPLADSSLYPMYEDSLRAANTELL
jgi:hypothetical protein